MYKPSTGDIIICNDVLGSVVDHDSKTVSVKVSNGSVVQIYRTANIQVVVNAYALAALVYNKIVKQIRKQ